MEDVVPALSKAIDSTFRTKMVGDKRIMRISRRIRDGTATLVDAHRYAQYTGENMSKALLVNLAEDNLPDGTLYFNIATRTVTPSLLTCHGLVNQISQQIQAIIDEQEAIGLKAIEADFPEERIKGLIDKMTSYDGDYEKSSAWLKEPIVNNVEAFFDDYIKANASFRQNTGNLINLFSILITSRLILFSAGISFHDFYLIIKNYNISSYVLCGSHVINGVKVIFPFS
jgi:hypothetical protein